jgi:excisionase family DNA binding protein
MEKLLTLHEVAEILRASPITLRIWASKRKIPVIKVGRMVRVSPKELEKWLKERSIKESNSHKSERPRSFKVDADFDGFLEELKDGK